jgi:type IV secretion system protein VirB9
MKPVLILAALSFALPCAARAADARIRTLDYDPARVTAVTGVFRTATQIVFGPDETVAHVALGDSAAWEVAADRNVLFIKPKAKGGPTDLIVTTDRGGETRSYVFALAVRAAASAGEVPFVLRFAYPQDAQAHAQAAVSAAEAALQKKVLDLKLERGAVEGPRNLAWSEQGPADLAPSEVSDNGRFIVLRFPGAQAVPAIYALDDGGTEHLAAFDVRGEFVVVHGLAPGLRLRRGREVLCLTDDAYRPAGSPTHSLTAAPDVTRTDQGAKP